MLRNMSYAEEELRSSLNKLEEVKNQIGEQLPGALDLFVKAASEFANKQLTTPEFFKMMEKGELLAKDILPLMGKYMSEAAKKGGALEKMLHGNMVAMNRLRQTWQNFQNAIFMGGFGEALTKWFNQLAAMLKTNEGFAKSFGAALGNVMDQLLDKFTMIYDYILILWLEFKYYILDQIPEGLKSTIGDWAAWAASILIVAKTFKTLFNIVSKLMGLGSIGAALGLGKAAKDAASMSGSLGGIIGAMSKLTLALGVIAPILMKTIEDTTSGNKGFFDVGSWLNPFASSDYQGLNSLKSVISPESAFLSPFRNQQPLPSSWAAAGQAGSTQPVKIEISTKDSEFGKAIDARIVDNDNKNINMLGSD